MIEIGGVHLVGLVAGLAQRLQDGAHPAPRRTLTQEDERMLADVAAYITAHCADRLPLERLARIGCMGVSKLKDAFHTRYG